MRCSVLTRSLLPRMRRSEGGTLTRSSSRPHAYKTGYWLPQIFFHQFFCIAGPSRSRFILWWMSLATNGSLPREMARGEPSFHGVERRGDSWSGRKVWTSGFLELGFHNNGSDSFSLGRPDLCELETETVTIHPPHHGPINTHWPLLVVKEQG